MKKTAILLIGFGGPEKSSEIRPFLDSVLEGIKIPPARYEAVVHHYEVVGGSSPYNAITRRQKDALAAELKKRGVDLPVYAGFRHSSPSFADIFRELKQKGFERVVGFVLSSLRSYPSFEKYCERVERGRKEADAEMIELVYTGDFHTSPLLIEAQAEKIKKMEGAYYLFSTHSIPVDWSDKSGYAAQFERMTRLIVEKLKIKDWGICYQSRSGNPRDPWLVPDVCDAIEAIDRGRFPHLVVTPSGFLSDNVEVLYDIDIEAKNKAIERGFGFTRSETVMDHPSFIHLMADQVQTCLK